MKKVLAVILISVMVVTLGGCNLIKNELGRMTSKLKGKQTIIQTYDEDSNIIDRVEGKSIEPAAPTR
jgi:uncharacterized protein YxeA